MLISLALGSLIGATALNFFSYLPTPTLMIAVFIPSFLFIGCGIWVATRRYFRLIGYGALGVVLGLGWAYTQAWQRLAWALDPQDVNHPIHVAGNVVGVPQAYEGALRFDLQLTQYKNKAIEKPVNIRLFWLKPTHFLQEGDFLQGKVQLKPPWHLANPGSFDQEKQFFLEEISASGKLLTLEHYQASQKCSLNRLRQYLNDRMSQLLGEKPLLGVIQATTLGLYKNISPEQWWVFQVTGTSHAIAISGLHISLVAMLCFKAISFLVRRSYYLTSLWPAQCYAAIAAMIGALLYSALAGFSVPTQRSLVMVIIAMGALLLRRPIFTWHGLALAWLVIAIFDPLSPLQMGFWLSFVSVGALIYGNTRAFEQAKWQQWVAPQWVAFLGIFPLSLLFFHQVTWLSPVANFLALPVINILVVPPSLLALLLIPIAPFLAKGALWLAHSALSVVWIVLEKISHFPGGIWYQASLPGIYLGTAFGGVVLLLAPKGIPGRMLGALSFLAALMYAKPALKPGECYFTLLDVGQGLASVIQTQHHVLLYDVGPQYGKTSDAGQRIIQPFLYTQGIHKIDKIVISHTDLDHRGGLPGLRRWPIQEIISSEPERLARPATRCEAGQSWEWDGVRFTFLNPIGEYKHRNDVSCVLKVETAQQSVLLTGDIESPAEKKMLQHFPEHLKSTLLVVPHHGSLTSSTSEFVAQTAPEYALYPVGMMNHYGFPKAEILARYEKIGSKNLLVAQTGALIFHLGKADLTAPVHWRETARRYWHRPSLSGGIR